MKIQEIGAVVKVDEILIFVNANRIAPRQDK